MMANNISGTVFVKGIYVKKEDKLKFGYNITADCPLDRDRKMVQDKWQFQTEGAKIVGKILDCDFSLDELWYDGMFSKTSFFERAYLAVSNDELYCLCDYIKNETADKFWAWFKKNEGNRHFQPAPMNTSELDKKDQKIVQDLSNIYVKVDTYKFRILKKSSQYVAPEDWLKKSIEKKTNRHVRKMENSSRYCNQKLP